MHAKSPLVLAFSQRDIRVDTLMIIQDELNDELLLYILRLLDLCYAAFVL